MSNDSLAHFIQQQHPYPLLFATIGGSQAFGYANEYSDYDVHGAHLVPLESVLGLEESSKGETVEVKELEYPGNGQKVEMATHELKKFIRLLLNGNGNVLEDLFSPLVVHTSDIHQELKEWGSRCLSLQHANHYKGMAYNQQRKMKGNETKKFLHMFRCLMMGTYLMETGELEMHLLTLAAHYKEIEVAILVEMKQGKTQVEWTDARVEAKLEHTTRWMKRLQEAAEKSELPSRPPETVKRALEALLIRVRLGEK